MRNGVRDKVIDDVMEAYVEWRQVSVEVDSTYRRWSIAPWIDPGRAFDAYTASLDREELSSLAYEQALRHGARLLLRDRRRRSAAARRRLKVRRPTRTRRRKRPRGPAGSSGRAGSRRRTRA